MSAVWVLGFVSAGGIGGFEWRETREELDAPIAELIVAGDDWCVREVDIPEDWADENGRVTTWLDHNNDTWEPRMGQKGGE